MVNVRTKNEEAISSRDGTGQNFCVRFGPVGWFLKPNWQKFSKDRGIYNNWSATIVTRSNLH